MYVYICIFVCVCICVYVSVFFRYHSLVKQNEYDVFNGRSLKTVSCDIFGLYYIVTRLKASTATVRRAEAVIIFQRVLRHTFACRCGVSTRRSVMAFRHREDAGALRVLLHAGRAKQFGFASARLSYD